MRLSLIICTRNRASQLTNCLEAVDRLNKPAGFELIVVDNGSTDQTARVIHDFAARFGHQLVYAHEPMPGLALARNAGIKAARGEIIAFTDDDCYVDPEFANAILQAFNSDEKLGFIGGRILLHDPEDLRLTIQESIEPFHFSPWSFITAGKVQGANFAFRREALESAGGFNVLLGSGTRFPAEDIEIVGRLSAMGWAGLYTPGPIVWHHHGRRTNEQRKKLLASYDMGRGAYLFAMLEQPTVRVATMKHWCSKIRAQRLGPTIRELKGAFGYFMKSRLRRGRTV